MIKPRIIVTGATGKTGSVVVTELLKAGYPVRAMVRREDERSARLKAQGAEIAVADMSAPPIHLVMGADAYAAIKARTEEMLASMEEHKDLTCSTNFDS